MIAEEHPECIYFLYWDLLIPEGITNRELIDERTGFYFNTRRHRHELVVFDGEREPRLVATIKNIFTQDRLSEIKSVIWQKLIRIKANYATARTL